MRLHAPFAAVGPDQARIAARLSRAGISTPNLKRPRAIEFSFEMTLRRLCFWAQEA